MKRTSKENVKIIIFGTNTKAGKLFDEIFSNQKKRIHKALLGSSPKEVLHFDKVIKRIINEKV